VEIINITKIIRIHDDFAGLWCEIETERGFMRSEMNKFEIFASFKYNFALENDLGNQITLRLFVCKGLESEMVG
jgi:hypothetical protein